MRHVDDGQMHAYLDGALHGIDREVLEEIELHLVGCAACQMRLEREQSVRNQAHAILEMAAPSRLDLPPFERVMQRPDAAPRRRTRPLRVVPLAWAASIVLAVGLGWLARAALRSAAPIAERHASMAPAPESAPAPASVVSSAAEPALPPVGKPTASGRLPSAARPWRQHPPGLSQARAISRWRWPRRPLPTPQAPCMRSHRRRRLQIARSSADRSPTRVAARCPECRFTSPRSPHAR